MIIQGFDFISNYAVNGIAILAFFGLLYFVLWISMMDRRDK